MTTFNYTTREINSNFKIKFYGTDSTGRKVNKLVGVRGLLQELGEELAQTLTDAAFNSMGDKFERKLRRGLKVTFYVH